MKKLFAALFLATSAAQALEWECGKSIELLSVQNSEFRRPTLVYHTDTDDKGKVKKYYKPLTAGSEAVADFLLALTDTTTVCLKAYDAMLPRPAPLMILDIKND